MAGRSMLLLALKRHTVSLNVTDRWLTEKLYIHSTPLHNAYMYAAKRWRAWRGTRLVRTLHDHKGSVIHAPDGGMPGHAEQQRAACLLGLEERLQAEAPTTAAFLEVPRPKYFDRFDEEKQQQAALWHALAREAQTLARTREPSRVLRKNGPRRPCYPEYGVPRG